MKILGVVIGGLGVCFCLMRELGINQGEETVG